MMDIEFGRDDSMVRRIARARCAEHPDSAKNWHYRSVTGRLSLLSDSANSWHYRGTLRFGATGSRYWRSGWTDQSGESVGIFHLGDFSIISKLKKTNNQTYAVLPAAKTEGGKLLFKLFQYISKIQ